MNKFIAYCGLNCETCEARIATINNDDELRKIVAEKWSKLNGIEIKPEFINCVGCKIDGVKTVFCDSLCEIKKCAEKTHMDTCGCCKRKNSCNKIKMIVGHNNEARQRLDIKK